MRLLLQKILRKPVTWLANKFSSRPNKERVLTALTKLYQHSIENPGKKGFVMNPTESDARYIIFSDQHKGAKNGSDDFMLAEPNYIAALNYYLDQNFHFISLGDEEELWENLLGPVKEHNKETTAIEKKFIDKGLYTKVFGNHDIFWNNDPFAPLQLANMYDKTTKIYEAVLLKIKMNDGDELPVFLTHGHQGDGQSDGNPFSAWFVGRIWAPLQAYLNLNPNIPAANNELKTAHNLFMYEWSKQDNNPVLITGHTHQPVFASLTHLERLYKQLDKVTNQNDETAAEKLKKEIVFRQHEYDFVVGNYTEVKPYYFNSGCCCYVDGDITGIEIADGMIRLIKWHKEQDISERIVLEEMPLAEL